MEAVRQSVLTGESMHTVLSMGWRGPAKYKPNDAHVIFNCGSDFVAEIAAVLRPEDEIWMSEIFYAGGTAVKDISANDLIQDIKQFGKKAYFVEDRNDLVKALKPHFSAPTVLLLMGARDPGLETFAKEVFEKL